MKIKSKNSLIHLFLLALIILILILIQVIRTKNIFLSSNNPLYVNSKAMKYENNPVFFNINDMKSNLVAGNCFFKDKNKTMLLYYADYNNSTAVFLAETTDGINFKKTFNEPVLEPTENSWDNGGVSVFPNCLIKKYDGTYNMYYTGSNIDNGDIYHSGNIGLATSDNLKDWNKHNFNPIIKPSLVGWDSKGVFEPSVYFSGNEYGKKDAYKIWYGGSDKNLRFQIGYAESHDGVNWKKNLNNPVLSYSDKLNEFDNYSIEVHSVRKINGYFIMFYEAIAEQFPEPFSIGLAFSEDGINWIKSSINPILEQGMQGDWDQMGVYHPSLVDINGKLFLYYVGLDYKFEHKIGFAEINPDILLKVTQ